MPVTDADGAAICSIEIKFCEPPRKKKKCCYCIYTQALVWRGVQYNLCTNFEQVLCELPLCKLLRLNGKRTQIRNMKFKQYIYIVFHFEKYEYIRLRESEKFRNKKGKQGV